MSNHNPIINKIQGFRQDGKEVDFFLPENILNDDERMLVFEFKDGSMAWLPFRGPFADFRQVLKEAYAYMEYK